MLQAKDNSSRFTGVYVTVSPLSLLFLGEHRSPDFFRRVSIL